MTPPDCASPEPVFDAPWHAQAFAIAVHLNERGAFTWSAWADVFGTVLAEHGLTKELDGGDDYFLAWITALERICERDGLADTAGLVALKRQWADAYLRTPHGAPVNIQDESSIATRDP